MSHAVNSPNPEGLMLKSEPIQMIVLDFSTIKNGNWDKWVQRLGTALHSDFEIESIFDSYYKVTRLGDLDNPVALLSVGKAQELFG